MQRKEGHIVARAGIGRPIDREKRRYRRAQVEAWRGSGLSQVEYCRREGLSPKAFRTWEHRLGAAKQVAEAEEVEFVAFPLVAAEDPSVVPGGGPASAALTVVVDDRYRVEVGDGFSVATLARVVQTLRAL
jgi:hypothetical protein